MSSPSKKLRDVLQEREVASFNKFWTILSMLNHFLYLSHSILVCINLSQPNLGQLCLSSSISIYHCPSLAILSIPGPFCTKIWYFGLSWAISTYPRLSLAISAILAYLHTCTLASFELSWVELSYIGFSQFVILPSPGGQARKKKLPISPIFIEFQRNPILWLTTYHGNLPTFENFSKQTEAIFHLFFSLPRQKLIFLLLNVLTEKSA